MELAENVMAYSHSTTLTVQLSWYNTHSTTLSVQQNPLFWKVRCFQQDIYLVQKAKSSLTVDLAKMGKKGSEIYCKEYLKCLVTKKILYCDNVINIEQITEFYAPNP